MDAETRLTVEELAKRWGVHHDTIYSMVRKKMIPHFRVGQRILFREGSIQMWEIQQEQKSMDVG